MNSNKQVCVQAQNISDETKTQIIEEVSLKYIEETPKLPDEKTCVRELIGRINKAILAHNAACGKDFQLSIVKELPLISIALLMSARGDIALVASGDKSLSNRKKVLTTEQQMKLPVGIYQKQGENQGVWELTNSYKEALGILIELYKSSATLNEKKEIFTLLKSRLRVIHKCVIPYFVPVQNGIVDVLQKKLISFSQDIVFTAKIHTNFNQNATNPVIHIPEDGSDWDVDSWLNTLGDPTFVEAIKEVIQASCLPLAPRDKMCLFYSSTGNNGKGTICQLIRNLLGEESTVSIPLNTFGKDFALSGLPGAIAVVVDENDVSSFSKGMANLKAAITGDTLSITRKYQNAFDYKFYGLILQCVNDFPKGDDKTSSFKRRLHIIPFPNCFTGKQKRYIKDRLIHDEKVLEYILKMVLYDMPYRDEFTEFPFTNQALNAYISSTNSVAGFLEEVLPECQWDLLPASDFLYEMYKVWYKKTVPSGKVIGRNDFIDSVKEYVDTTLKDNPCFEWEWTDSTRSAGRMDCEEPLLGTYGLVHMVNISMLAPTSHYYLQVRKEKYSGLKRRFAVGTQGTDEEQEEV